MSGKKALIGMSGGVDSSVAALLMKQAGFECIGATMRLYNNEDIGLERGSTCCSLDDVEDARFVAHRIGIPHYVFNFSREFDEDVMQAFVNSYESGETPNPCIECNRYLKFGKLLHRAEELGCDYVVSGHYARVRFNEKTGRFLLCKAADPTKDQTYFLYPLSQEQLSHILFPLGELTKTEVRSIAGENGFLNAKKHDSQDICFVPEGDYVAFMERYTGKQYAAGDYLDTLGNVIGKHRGAVAYTLGQRKGLGIALGQPMYVCEKNMVSNTVTLGSNEDLFSPALLADNWTWFPFETLTSPMEVTAKIRHSQREVKAMVYPEENGRCIVRFETPQRAVTPGQAVVLYSGEVVVGGGTIRQALKQL